MSDLETVLWALPRIYGACRARGTSKDAETPEVSDHQARILAFLDEHDPTMVTELADHMGVTASTMSLNLKRLRAAGLVTRERDPEDGRVVNIRLSESGARARDRLNALDPARVDALLQRLGPEGRRSVMLGLRLLAGAAEELAAGAPLAPIVPPLQST